MVAKAGAFAYTEQSGRAKFVAINLQYVFGTLTSARLVYTALDLGVFMVRKRKARKPVTREISNFSAGATVLFLAAMLQWAAVLAVCPSVHELIHHDADDEHHDCAVTLFLAGQVEQALLHPIVIWQPAQSELPLSRTYDARASGSFFLSCRILEHAPPLRS